MNTNRFPFTVLILVVLVAAPVLARGGREDGDAPAESSDAAAEAPTDAAVEAPPEWVVAIQESDFESLYPGPDGGGYIGFGIGGTREEAVAAAAVDFAGNVSTEVDATVTERGTAASDGSDSFQLQIESEVRSQAIVSGLQPLTWTDPESEVVYALYRATAEEYTRRLEAWAETMESISEVERRREIQRLEEERAEAERRLEEIKIEELQDQVREADRRVRANRHREFLSMQMPGRERAVPTAYHAENGEFSLGYRGHWDEQGLDGYLDFSAFRIIRFGVGGEGFRRWDDGDVETLGAVTGRADVQLLDRVGWVTSTNLVAGVYGGGDLDEDLDPEWVAGPYLAADVLLPEAAHTRFGAYAGTDLIHLRAAWYPFWRTIEDAVSVTAAGQFVIPEYGVVLQRSADRNYAGLGVTFRPADGFWVAFETRNVSSIRGSITVSY